MPQALVDMIFTGAVFFWRAWVRSVEAGYAPLESGPVKISIVSGRTEVCLTGLQVGFFCRQVDLVGRTIRLDTAGGVTVSRGDAKHETE